MEPKVFLFCANVCFGIWTFMTMHLVHVSRSGCLLMHNLGGFFGCCFEIVNWIFYKKAKGCNIVNAVLRFLGKNLGRIF